MSEPLVSIISITYNQENYIKDALNSFLSQNINFPLEIIVADDHSSDKTPMIISQYHEKNPNVLKPVLRNKNVGAVNNCISAMQMARGKYIALCEGDDYWTSPNKLQKQIDLLESNPKISICFHPVKVVFEGGSKKSYTIPDSSTGLIFNTKRLLKANFIQTNSVVYRRQNYRNIPNNIMPLDWFLHLYHAQFGTIGFINEVMSVYRRHPGGIWWDEQSAPTKIIEKYGGDMLRFHKEVLALYGDNHTYKKIILSNACKHTIETIRVKGEKTARELLKSIPDFTYDMFQFSVNTNMIICRELSIAKDNNLKNQNIIDELSNRNKAYEEQFAAIQRSRAYKLSTHISSLTNIKKQLKKRANNGLKPNRNVTVVIPVYGDWKSLQVCIFSLQKYLPAGNSVLLINDCGPEVDFIEKKIINNISDLDYKYYRNDENLGFIKTCNRAVYELDKTKNDILLLNSDTKVTEGVLEDMIKVLYRSKDIASVSPRSNNATVFSIPFEAATDYNYPPQKSYDIYKKIRDKLPEVYETPTTHGFCMLIKRSVINKYGLFDEIYGKG